MGKQESMSKYQVYDTNHGEDFRLAEEKLRASDEDLQQEAQASATETIAGVCPFGHSSKEAVPYRYVPLRMGGRGGTHVVSEGSRALIDNEVTLDDLKTTTDAFYELAFEDRSSAHAAAWFSPKRPQREVGRRFKLDECRVWMRLHFYAMRKTGMMEKSPSFADYYVRFIGHFISVYEGSAPMFARDSLRWSANPANVEKYFRDGRVMRDVLGREYSDATSDLPEDELHDDEWPYFASQ